MAPDSKQQFNVYLDPELIRATKRASLDRHQTLSDFTADALRSQLNEPPGQHEPQPGEVTPLPILFVHNMRESMKLFRALGLRLGSRSRNGRWAELDAANGMVALHFAEHDDEQRVTLAFQCHGPLEPLAKRLTDAGFTVDPIVDEGFGRTMDVHGPDGLVLRIDASDPDLYA